MSRFAGPAHPASPKGSDSRRAAAAQPRPLRPWEPPAQLLRGKPAERARPSLGGLPERLQTGIEALSGLAMDDVRVHRNSAEPARLGALAFTKGSEIHLGPGQERHLPHEAWHVVQQKQGRVAATTQLKKSGVAINDDQALEREADRAGAHAARMSDEAAAPAAACPPSGAAVTQRLVGDAVIQLYRIAGGDMISQDDQLALSGPKELYASDDKIREANSLAGAVEFFAAPGARKTIVRKWWQFDRRLSRVGLRLKPSAELPLPYSDFGPTDARGAMVHYQADTIAADFAAANQTRRDGNDLNEANLAAYIAREDDAGDAQILPSDCDLMRNFLTGQGQPGALGARMTPGSYYSYRPGPDPDAAEWKFHWGTVVMTDGDDHVTLEGAAAKASERFSKKEFDKSWSFKMYGSAADQTFQQAYHAEMGAGATVGRHAPVVPQAPEG